MERSHNMTATTDQHEDEVCVDCKSRERGYEYCRTKLGHGLVEYPGTSLTQKHCKAHLDFKENALCIKEQIMLQQAQQDGGSTGVDAVLDELMGT